jgi:ABC-type Zn uptake system ZnuABC Zn-binding protein ZnuA
MLQQMVRQWCGMIPGFLLAVLSITPGVLQAQSVGSPLQVVATIPELGSLVREVGGNQVAVTVLAKGTEDPHFVIARPSYIKVLNQADVYVQMGLELEIGWAPTLLQQASNPHVLPGTLGYIDTSMVINPLQVASAPVDRSQGDVHALGNPHYLLDPLQGLVVARFLRDRLGAVRPAQQAYFQERYTVFAQRLGTAMVGEALARKYDVEKLALLYENGRLQEFLQSQGDASLLAGWLGRMAPYAGTRVVGDHNQWPYFAQRFRLEVVGFLEPKPGYPPPTAHLQALVQIMRAQNVRLILASAYYDPRHARFLAQHTGAKVAEMANQGGARPGTEDYLRMVDYNVNQFVTALGGV